MRIADKMNYEQVKGNLTKNRSDMADLQNQAATMKKLLKPSDDPVATARILASRTDRAVNDQYLKNMEVAKGFLTAAEQALGDVGESLLRAKELALSQANDASANETTRRTVAAEIDQIYRHVINIGNRKLGDRYVFGGFKTTVAPFDMKGGYRGDSGEIKIEVNKGVYVPMNVAGNQIFLGQSALQAPAWTEEQGRTPQEQERIELRQIDEENKQEQRRLASVANPGGIDVRDKEQNLAPTPETEGDPRLGAQDGLSIFKILQNLGIGLRTNDKTTIQDTLNDLDSAIEQVVLARSRLGSRVMNLDSIDQTHRKTNIEAKSTESRLEDADVYELFTDLSRTENTLKSSLSTSGKLIQPSLLDFLK